MSDAWYSAFGLLTLLGVVNSVLLVAVMRQVGLLHQRIPPTGAGSVGPRPGASFEPLAMSLVPGATQEGGGEAPVEVLAFVTPDCSLCERIPGFLDAYEKTRPGEERDVMSFALATDASESRAQRFCEAHKLRWPFFHHPDFKERYELSDVGAPYVLALTNEDGAGGQQILLAGGIVNTLEQFEDLTEIALARYLALISDESTDGHTPGPRSESRNAEGQLTVIGGRET